MSTPDSVLVFGDVDTPRPIFATGGRLSLRGWCLVCGQTKAPAVRLRADSFTLPARAGPDRTDVPRLYPAETAARTSGFLIEAILPAGVHLARLEARLPDGSWQTWRTLCLAAEARPFATGIDSPAAGNPVTQRVHVEGWALAPDNAIDSLSLRYGHQEIACDLGRQRSDVPALYPDSAHAARAGFKSRVILSAGIGSLRLKAKLTDGSVRVARTLLAIAVATDENVGSEIALTAPRIGLPRANPAESTGSAHAATEPLNVLFILYGSFSSNSALHVAALANELARAGHACAVAVPHDAATIHHLQDPRFRALSYADAEAGVTFPDGRGPNVIHAWTTRENVRILTTSLRRKHAAKVLVHLEDNEQQLLALQLGRSASELAALSPADLDRLVPKNLSHPIHSREFLASADGVTVITETLREFVPPDRSCLTLPPAADARYFFPQPQPAKFRRTFLRRSDETVLFYHGNVHATNAAEMRELYAAVLLLNERGQPVTLLRTGRDTVDFLGDLAARVAPHVINLGEILHHHHLPSLMALADIFVQPGGDDAFNRYRFPSKLPEFFAMGRPVILPRTNLGTTVRHGIDAYVVEQADVAAITKAVIALAEDRPLRERLATGAATFARSHFSWPRSAAALAKFYAGLAT